MIEGERSGRREWSLPKWACKLRFLCLSAAFICRGCKAGRGARQQGPTGTNRDRQGPVTDQQSWRAACVAARGLASSRQGRLTADLAWHYSGALSAAQFFALGPVMPLGTAPAGVLTLIAGAIPTAQRATPPGRVSLPYLLQPHAPFYFLKAAA